MIAAGLGRVPVKQRFQAIYVVLVGVAAAALFVGGLLAHAPTLHQTRTVRLNASQTVRHLTPPQLVAALGKPDIHQTQQGGIVCSVWRTRKLEVCYQP